MKPKNFDWIDQVLADIQNFCELNQMSATSVELANARSTFSREKTFIKEEFQRLIGPKGIHSSII